MRVVGLLLLLALGGCVVVFQRADVTAVDPARLPLVAAGGQETVASPLRVHLVDGSVVLFPDGATVSGDSLWGGNGRLLTFPDGDLREISGVGLDRVLGAEVYATDTDVASTLLATAAATAVASYALAGAAVVLFGSCPTVYAATPGDTLALEAELFSNSIAPLFEMRDRDVLRTARPGADGLVRLEIRNEALETHFLNHLALEAVAHAPDTRAVPAESGQALVLGLERAPRAARDRAGRDVRPALLAADGHAYATDDAVTAAVTERDFTDWVTLTFDRPDTDSAAVALRFRSSLLTTVLLYEHILGGQGPRALDWMGQEMASIGPVAVFGDYYVRRLGLRVEVEDADGFREVGRLAEAGPIAWVERAVVVPVPDTPQLRIRLRFVADGWRLDRASLAAQVATVGTAAVPLLRLTDDHGAPLPDLEARLGRPDQDYAVQGPGRVVHATFAPPSPPPGQAQTLFVSAQGYYTEWVRPEWLRRPASTFEPTDSTFVAAIRSWRRLRPAYEGSFWSSRLPVR